MKPVLPTDGSRRFWNGCAIFGDEHRGDAIVGANPVDVMLDYFHAGRLPRSDRLMQIIDRRLFQSKVFIPRIDGIRHGSYP
jgi:hypothetical protein